MRSFSKLTHFNRKVVMSRLFFPNNLKEKTMAAAFIRDEGQKEFLVKNTKWNKWSGPGGHVEGNE